MNQNNTRVCLKIAFRQMCTPICGRFGPDEGGVVGYVDRIRVKYTAKWSVQMAEMNFKTRSRACLKIAFCQMCVTVCGRFAPKEGSIVDYVDRMRGKSPAKLGKPPKAWRRADGRNEFSDTL